jgi:hypothetical protein
MKRCRKCRHWKSPECFYKHEETADRLQPDCVDCLKKRSVAWLRNNPDKRRRFLAEYRQRPEVKERRNDYERLRRAMRKAAKARTKGLTPNGNGIREAAS